MSGLNRRIIVMNYDTMGHISSSYESIRIIEAHTPSVFSMEYTGVPIRVWILG